MPGRKQRSLYRQKRKRGFYGVQKQFVEQEASRNDSATVDDDEDVVLSHTAVTPRKSGQHRPIL